MSLVAASDEYAQLVRRGIYATYECKYCISIQYYKQAIALQPNNFCAHFYMSNDFVNWRKEKHAKTLFEDLLRKSNAQIIPMPEIYQIIVQGYLLELDQQLEQAKQKYSQAIALDAVHYHANYFCGLIFCSQNKFDEALPYFKQAKKNPPFNKCAVYNTIGWCWLSLQDKVKAEKYFKKALQHNPNYVVALMNLSELVDAQEQEQVLQKAQVQ